jgi:hypothetical protein
LTPRDTARTTAAHMTANELFLAISPALATRILDDVHASDKELYRVALNAVAQVRRVRPLFLERQPRADRHRQMAETLLRSDMETIAGNVISGWLVKNHQQMLVDFLNALNVPNEKGVVENLPTTVPDADLDKAIELLLSKYEPETVALYLRAFNDLNEAKWPNLATKLDSDERLKLG